MELCPGLLNGTDIGINGHIWVWITIAGASVLDYGRAELGFQAQRVAGSDNVSLSKPRQRSCCALGRFRASRSIGQTQFLHILNAEHHSGNGEQLDPWGGGGVRQQGLYQTT